MEQIQDHFIFAKYWCKPARRVIAFHVVGPKNAETNSNGPKEQSYRKSWIQTLSVEKETGRKRDIETEDAFL